jgi:hypothetical protein
MEIRPRTRVATVRTLSRPQPPEAALPRPCSHEGRGRLYGDGVNVAARLEALAEPGGICLSASAHEQVQDRIAAVRFEHLGEQRVKSIARPIRAYRVALGLAGSEPSPDPALPSWSSIAVLPLDNLSADPEQVNM